ncbi:hypothetical protein [Compostimonas suwonensis]|uniref:Uncharacterized protein n=1 Tax=Compostimonas suwonensis TaxID=1048394 RepID=A0A2M9BVQ7_9MICO|nr:hypothetical protein [Compostimonas suwonensis]PJJ62015.1 hypothetical protein CLV54_1807 [Compostimonas suwonensis]
MIGVLIAAHVVAALLAIGPIAVAASLFPRAARALAADPADPRAGAAATLLHRVSRIYTIVAIAVPALGLAIAIPTGKLGQAWLLISLALTLVAAIVLAAGILPVQQRVLARARANEPTRIPALATRAAMLAGVFNLLWVVVAVLMVLQPGAPRYGA